MAHTENAWLEKFEVKKPDYDLSERDYVGMQNAKFAPARYVCKDDIWKTKKTGLKLFGGSKKKARLMFVGDITCFEKQFEEARNGADYDFNYLFERVKPVFAQADLVVGNLETMIFPDAPYRTEKYVSEQNFHCNAPLEFLDAVRNAGIDVVTNANNHDLDTGAIGIGETIDRTEQFGLIQTGTFKTDKKRYELFDIGGFKVAIVAFATDHNNKKCNLTQEGIDFLLNDYSAEKAEEIIQEAWEAGAELVFTCIHWGKENKTVNNRAQTAIAEELADMGYDCIIGSHPHVLQPVSLLKLEDKTVPVFYSMGNFSSHNVNNQKSRSIIACIDLERTGAGVALKCSYIPIYTSKNYGKHKYTILPINAKPRDPGNIRKKELIEGVIGNEIPMNTGVTISESIERPDMEQSAAKTTKLNLAKVKEFPVPYNNGKFLYSIYEDYARMEGIAPECATSSYSVSEKVEGLPIREIAAGAFAGNRIMKKINFGKNLAVIGERTCKDCVQLEGFQLGSNITEIQEEAFAGCTALTATTMRKRVKKIGSKAFWNCSSLRSVKIPPNVSEIAEDAFEGCTRAVFYCEAGSYAEAYAKKHGFPVVNMKLY